MNSTPGSSREADGFDAPNNGQECIVGRESGCHWVLGGEGVSRRHAKLYVAGATVVVEDLGSSNGTWLNGEMITRPMPLRIGDVIGVGEHRFELSTDGRFRRQSDRPRLTVEARRLAFDVPERRLLEGVSLTLFSSELVGVMGPSGAGKTTLMNMLNGYSPPSQGQVLVNGLDLYSNYDRCSGLFGYVPQDDVMHRDLTVRQALRFSGRLRLPPETTDAEIDDRIRRVLRELQIEGTLDVRIGSPERKGISGGQRKRVNLAMELLCDPAVLFVDEPTSGLSSEDALAVLSLLRQLADAGKCVLLTLHQPNLESFRKLDLLVVVARDAESAAPGKLVYFGPAHPDAVRFFEPSKEQSAAGPEASPDGVLRGLARHPVEQWSRKYQESSYHRRFVAARAGRVPNDGDAAVAPPRNDDWLRQSATLIRRNLALKLADGWNTAILLAQAPIIALLIVLVFGRRAGQTPTADNWTSTNAATATTIFLLVLTAIWFGCSNAAREIVGEWAVYRRERMVHLRLSAYLTSKLVVGALLCSVQCAMLLATARLGCGLKGPIAATYLILMTAACTGIGIGLVISAIARTQEVAMGLLPLVLIPMVIFGGSLLPVHNMQRLIRPVANVMPTRHGFEALMLLEASRKPLGPSPYSNTILTDASVDDPDRPDIAEHYLPRNRRLGVTESTLALLFLFGAAVVSIVLILRYRDVH